MAKKKPAKPATRKKAAKAVTKKAPVVQTNRLVFLTLDRIWLAAAVLFLGLAAAAPFVMEPISYMFTQAHLARDALLSQDGTAFIPAHRAVWDMELRWALSTVMALSAVLPILYLTKLKDRYANRLISGRVVEWRWLDLAVTSALMVVIVAMLVGYTDIGTLKMMAGAMVLACGLGWLAEQQNNQKSRRPVWSALGLGVIAGALPWLVIGIAKASTLLFGGVRSPWYVYAACVIALGGFILLALNQWNQHRRFRAWADYAFVERNYALISVATKVAFAAVLIIGLAK